MMVFSTDIGLEADMLALGELWNGVGDEMSGVGRWLNEEGFGEMARSIMTVSLIVKMIRVMFLSDGSEWKAKDLFIALCNGGGYDDSLVSKSEGSFSWDVDRGRHWDDGEERVERLSFTSLLMCSNQVKVRKNKVGVEVQDPGDASTQLVAAAVGMKYVAWRRWYIVQGNASQWGLHRINGKKEVSLGENRASLTEKLSSKGELLSGSY